MDAAHSQQELHDKLLQLGWTLKKLERKGDVYVAKGTGPNGYEIQRDGRTPGMALAGLVSFAGRHNYIRHFASMFRVAAWDSHWLGQHKQIAESYHEAPVYDPKAVEAWGKLAHESKAQADAIRTQVHVEMTDKPQPYPTAKDMREDVHRNGHLFVSTANTEHPVWSPDEVINFRIVHDVLGYCQSGGHFSWRGANLASQHHMPLVSPDARKALFVEAIAQPAYLKHFGRPPEHKIALLDDHLTPMEEAEGEHPSVPHGGVAYQQVVANSDGNLHSPNIGRDPNHNWEWMTPVSPDEMITPEPLPVPHPDPAQHVRHPDDYMDWQATHLNAKENVPRWHDEETDEWIEWWDPRVPVEEQDRTVMDAFRVAILSPLKHLKWNAAHYQAIRHFAPSAKAWEMFDYLEQEREAHNLVSKNFDRDASVGHNKQLKELARQILNRENRQRRVGDKINDGEAYHMARKQLFEMELEAERLYMAAAARAGVTDLDPTDVINGARGLVTSWTTGVPKKLTPQSKPADKELYGPNFPSRPQYRIKFYKPRKPTKRKRAADEPWAHWDEDDWQRLDPDRPYQPRSPLPIDLPEAAEGATGPAAHDAAYAGFMAQHLQYVASVGQYIPQIRQAALKDIEEGGNGWHFRQFVMNLNLRGVNPKVASFAWLMLAPETSELGIIDTHIAQIYGVDDAKMSVKDYYQMEARQKAAKDASGYHMMPLGQYHWAMWDMKRTPGKQSRHSSLRALNPTPWRDEEWEATVPTKKEYIEGEFDAKGKPVLKPWTAPPGYERFELTRPVSTRAALEYEERYAGHPQAKVPNPDEPPRRVKVKASADTPDPDYVFVYYAGKLKLEKWKQGTRHKVMFESLLKEHGTDIQSFTNEFQTSDLAAGDIYKMPDNTLQFDMKQLSDPEVEAAAKQAVYKQLTDEWSVVEGEDDWKEAD